MRYTSLALFLSCGAFGTAAFGGVNAPSGAGQTLTSTAIHGTWTMEIRDARAFLQLRTPPTAASDHDNSMGQSLSIDEFSGLPASDPQFTVSAVKFELRREAGTIAFDGAFRDGRGAGLFEFTERPEYTAEMKALGYSDVLATWDRFVLAVHDVGPRYVRALRAEGYDTLTLDEIRRGRNHGVTLEFIRDMKTAGYKVPFWDDLVRARDHGVTPAYIGDLKAAGFSGLTLDELVRARDHGVTKAFMEDMRRAGFGSLTMDQYVRAKDHGVNQALLDGLSKEGYKNLPLEDVIRVKDHGVSPEYIEDMKALKIDGLTLDQLVRLKDHGITPGFVNHVRARGFKENTPDDLISLKNHGLSRE